MSLSSSSRSMAMAAGCGKAGPSLCVPRAVGRQQLFVSSSRNTDGSRSGVAMKGLKKVQLGTAEVTNACLGTMMMGSTNTEEESVLQLDHFLEAGGNFIDTAEAYPVPMNPDWCGDSEVFIGKWMKERGCRDDVILATKACGPVPDWNTNIQALVGNMRNKHLPEAQQVPEEDLPKLGHTAANYKLAIEASLLKLQTDYIDLYQLHWPDRYTPIFGKHMYDPELQKNYEPTPFEESVAAVGELLESGKIKQWGLSNENAYGVTMMCETAKRLGVPLPVSIQNDYSITDRHFDMDLAEACNAYGIKLLSYGSLNGGFHSGKYLDGKKPEGARHTKNSKFQHRYTGPAVEEALKKYKVIADEKGLTLTQFVIAWTASRWHLGSVITGQTSIPQLEEYLSAFDVTLDEDTLAEVDRIHMQNRNPNWAD